MNVTVAGVSIEIDDHAIITGVDVEVGSGTLHGIVGPNGSGKSTLLRCIYRSLKPTVGVVRLDGSDLWRDLSARSAARQRAVVSQDASLDMDFSVRDVVAMGRAPHKGLFERDNAHDDELIDAALVDVGMAWATQRLVATLSGGERQRVFLGRALVQQAPVLVLDEPTNHLDVRAQLELLELVRGLRLTTIAALHDLDQAASLCDMITVMQHGGVVTTGVPSEVLTPSLIGEVFGVQAHIGPHPLTGRLHVAVAPLTPTPQPHHTEVT